MKIVQLFTPGLDSYLSDWCLREDFYKDQDQDIDRLYFDLNSKYSMNEKLMLERVHPRQFYKITNCINISNIEHDDAHVPNRNLLLVVMAQSLTDADIVYINGMKDDRVSDNNKDIFDAFSLVLSKSAEKQVTVTSPFWKSEKSEIVKSFTTIKYQGDEEEAFRELIQNTYSCFSGILFNNPVRYWTGTNDHYVESRRNINSFGCLKCPACFRRLSAIAATGFFVPFSNHKIVEKYRSSIDKDKLPLRNESTMNFIKFLDWRDEDGKNQISV